MIQNQVGFVLKRFYPLKSKITVLSMHAGKYDLIFKKFDDCLNLWPGMLVSFTTEQTQNTMFGANTKILVNPNIHTEQSIYLMHHILEICNLFIPYDKPCPEIFDFLKKFMILIDSEYIPEKHLTYAHKIFTAKLISLFGFCSHNPILTYLAIYETLTTTFVDFSQEQKVEFWEKHLRPIREKYLDECILEKWILEHLKIHPQSGQLKTIPFVYKH